MTQSEVRQMFVRANPGTRLPGYGGYWYRCAKCGKWCGRPGKEGAQIPEDCKMEVDHRISKRYGGSDQLYNLQPLCKPCNRNKKQYSSTTEIVTTAVNAVTTGNIGDLAINLTKQKVKDALGIKYRRK